MAKIGESLEQKINTVAEGLNRIINLINMLQKDNFKRLIYSLSISVRERSFDSCPYSLRTDRVSTLYSNY